LHRTGPSLVLAVFISRPQAVKSAQENSTTNASLNQHTKVAIRWYYMLVILITSTVISV